MRPTTVPAEDGSAVPTSVDTAEPEPQEPAPAPVFVSLSGLRGRLMRGFGWPLSLLGAMLAAAMVGSIVGVQSDAPAMGIPPQPTPASPKPTGPQPVLALPSSEAVEPDSTTSPAPGASATKPGGPTAAPAPAQHPTPPHEPSQPPEKGKPTKHA